MRLVFPTILAACTANAPSDAHVSLLIDDSDTAVGLLTEDPDPDPHDTGTAPLAPVDLLLVVDDSCSMYAKQRRLADAIPALVGALADAGLAWEAIVTPVDHAEPVAWVSYADPGAADALAHAVVLGTTGTPWEQGIDVTIDYLDRYGLSDPEAVLAVLVVSDEEDGSDASVEDLAAALPEGATFSAIVSEDPVCAEAVSPGSRYLDAVARIGGVVGHICDEHYQPTLVALAGVVL